MKCVEFFKHNGFSYYKLWENQTFVLYRQESPIEFNKKIVYGFELHKKVLLKPVTLKGVYYPLRYKLPKDEDFGKIAWSFQTLDGLQKYCSNASFGTTVTEIQGLFDKKVVG